MKNMDTFMKTLVVASLLMASLTISAQQQDSIASPASNNPIEKPVDKVVKVINNNVRTYDSAVTVDSLGGLNDSLSPSAIIRTYLDITEMRTRIEGLKAEVNKLSQQNDSLFTLLKEKEKGEKYMLHNMAEKVDQLWLNKPYGEMDSTLFVEEALYAAHQGEDVMVDKAYEKLKTLGANYKSYREGVRAVNSPYDAVKVKELNGCFEKLLSQETIAERKEELGVIYKQLQNYNDYVDYFKNNIIVIVDEKLEGYKDDGTAIRAWNQIETFLKEKDNGKVEMRLTSIPWLKTQYESYIESLKKDPYGYNEAAEAIKKLETF